MSLFQYYCIGLALAVCCSLSILVAPRELAPLPLPPPPLGARMATNADAAGKAAGGGGPGDCWSALSELRSCTDEIVLFFLNGDSYLSLPCCRAIRVATRNCWPAMMASLGFTSEEADILRGYCDVAPPPTSSSSTDVPAPTGAAAPPVSGLYDPME